MKVQLHWAILIAGIVTATSLTGCTRKPKHSQTIHEAVKNGDKDTVEEFLAQDIQVNSKDKFGLTPLHYAAMYGQKEIAELLIAQAADVNTKNNGGGTPLGSAAMGIGQNREVAELLIANGADVNTENFQGQTPLHQAVMAGQPTIVRLLLSEGANPKAKDNDGKTPLDRAIIFSETKFRRGTAFAKRKKAFEECVEILRVHGGK